MLCIPNKLTWEVKKMRRHELTQTQWKKIKNLLPAEKKPHAGRPAKDNRAMLHAMIYWLNTGIAWRDLPERFGPWQSVYTRMRRWNDKGIWNQVVEELVKLDIIDRPTIVWNNTPIKNYSEEEQVKTPY